MGYQEGRRTQNERNNKLSNRVSCCRQQQVLVTEAGVIARAKKEKQIKQWKPKGQPIPRTFNGEDLGWSCGENHMSTNLNLSGEE